MGLNYDGIMDWISYLQSTLVELNQTETMYLSAHMYFHTYDTS